MLILTRKPGESVYIIYGDSNIKVTIVEIKGHQIRVGIDAPKDIKIYREEIYIQILEENKQAAEAALQTDDLGLEGLTEAWGGFKQITTAGQPSSSGVSKAPEVVLRRRKKKSSDE